VIFKKNSFETLPQTHLGRVWISERGMVLGKKVNLLLGEEVLSESHW